MKIVDPQDNLGLIAELKRSGAKVGLSEVNGHLHDGHNFMFEQVKGLVDVNLVSLVQWNHYCFQLFDYNDIGITKGSICHNYSRLSFEEFVGSIPTAYERNIDYLVASPLTDDISAQADHWMQYRSQCIQFCKDRKIGFMWPQVLIAPIVDMFDGGAFQCYVGPKNIIPDLAGRRLFGSDRFWNPAYVWSALRGASFETVSRSSNSAKNGVVLQAVVERWKRDGRLSVSDLSAIKEEKAPPGTELFIIDTARFELTEEATRDCAIICENRCCADYLFVRDGDIVC